MSRFRNSSSASSISSLWIVVLLLETLAPINPVRPWLRNFAADVKVDCLRLLLGVRGGVDVRDGDCGRGEAELGNAAEKELA